MYTFMKGARILRMAGSDGSYVYGPGGDAAARGDDDDDDDDDPPPRRLRRKSESSDSLKLSRISIGLNMTSSSAAVKMTLPEAASARSGCSYLRCRRPSQCGIVSLNTFQNSSTHGAVQEWFKQNANDDDDDDDDAYSVRRYRSEST